MNHHEFCHEMAMIHAAMSRVLERLPATYEKERQELLSVKHKIESFIVSPDDVLLNKEV